MINKQIIFRLLGFLLLMESVFLFVSLLMSLFYREFDWLGFALAFGATFLTGGSAVLFTQKADKAFGKREGYIIVSLVWVVFSLFGALPFIISGAIPNFTDAFFETMSGFTTTGASIINNIEALPHGILFWRSLTQWMGGMGIIVLSIAILPFLGVGGVQLFSAEVPGLSYDKLHPRVRETAQRLWIIYVGFTLIETVLLWLGGMSFFDALNHSFTTMSSGGYSTKQASIAYFTNPFIHYVIVLFMFIAGVNFTLAYFALKLDFKKVFSNEEFRVYSLITLVFTGVIALRLFVGGGISFEESFRSALFQVVSIVTTTGYATVDYLLWPSLLIALIFVLMFIGGSAGATSGGVKVIRIILILKNCYFELKRIVHPKAIIPMRLNGKTVPQPIVNSVLAFIVFYLLIFIAGSVFIAGLGLNMESAMGAVASALGNIGPGLGSVGPAETYAHLPQVGKWLLSFLMLLGRLELFTVLIIFAPTFWKK
ncbi:MAG: potassium transporter [Bacteroidetes bacterium HGW-Bacteroidetes-4]|jgi:trk system potassium uptake protein TrkH|nr:MAG: potassium transporter [Bacteroidetes bacterium HGW-Bacteroidetes-4]